MPWPEHVVHRIGEALCALVAVRVVCGVHAAEAKAVQAGPVFHGRCVCCHHAHLRIKTTRRGVIRPREAAISWKNVTRGLCHELVCGWIRLYGSAAMAEQLGHCSYVMLKRARKLRRKALKTITKPV